MDPSEWHDADQDYVGDRNDDYPLDGARWIDTTKTVLTTAVPLNQDDDVIEPEQVPQSTTEVPLDTNGDGNFDIFDDLAETPVVTPTEAPTTSAPIQELLP